MAEKLRQASARGSYKEVVRLLDDGTAFEADENGRTALHLASSAGHADVVGILLSSGCGVNARDLAGCTALQRAAADGHLEVVRQLIKYGADVNYQDNVHGNTALHEASWKGYSRTVAALGRARANLHLKNRGGFAALHLCCQNGHNQSCRELLLAGCDPDLQNNYGDTPLHTSARYGHAGVTRILISAECHVSDQNKNGDTALHIAAAMGRRKLTRILLEAGCDKNLCNKQNETARDIAIRKDLKEIIQILDSPPPLPQTKLRESSRRKPNDKKREKNGSGTSSKDSGSRHKDKKKQKHAHKVQFEKSSGKQWSPYGCHYYPDPKQFPSPNLDTLPHEPLMKGEQYYLDLAGNIRKGPIGVGYTCYCAPFFRHMEARLDRDKQELKDHIDLAHEKLDQKVANLEQKTQDQIQELSQTVSQEKNRCEERHLYLTKWLQGELGGHPEDRAPLPIQRTRSLELLLDEGPREHWRAHGDANSADELDDHVKWDGRRVRRIAWKEHGHPEGLEQNTWRSHRHHNYNAQEPYPLEPYNQEETGTVVESWQGQRLKEMDDRSSDSSEGEEDQVTMYSRVHNVDYGFTRQPSLNKSYCAIPNKNPDYENIVSYKNGQYKVQESHNLPNYPLHSHISEYPGEEYRALDLDPHNDSGYSTKIYGSSKGPSPALSGQADCINGLPQTAYTSQLPSLYERAYPSGERQTSHNIGAASLV